MLQKMAIHLNSGNWCNQSHTNLLLMSQIFLTTNGKSLEFSDFVNMFVQSHKNDCEFCMEDNLSLLNGDITSEEVLKEIKILKITKHQVKMVCQENLIKVYLHNYFQL